MQVPPNWFDMIYPRYSPPMSSADDDDYTIPSPTSVEVPNLRPADNVRWSSLFPSAPVVVQRPPPEDCILLRSSTPGESISSPMSSPTRSVVSYTTKSSIHSEPMTPMSRMSGELIPVPNKPTTDKVDSPKAVPVLSTPTPTASTSTAIAPPAPPGIHLVSFFFENIQRLFKVPTTVDLSYGGFEVTFKPESIAWTDAIVDAASAAASATTDSRAFELMPAPANTALHRYVKDLARVRVDLAALEPQEDPVVEELVLRVRTEQEIALGWMRAVCEAAGTLSLADPAFSPRK